MAQVKNVAAKTAVAKAAQTAAGTDAAKSAAGVVKIGHTIDDTKGKMWGQRVIVMIQKHHGEWTKLVHELWGMSNEARKAALDTITKFRTDAVKNAAQSGPIEGIKPDQWGKIARTTTVRIAHVAACVRAMNGSAVREGLTLETFAKSCGVDQDEARSKSVEILYQYCRNFNGARAATGRPQDPADVKLAKFIDAAMADDKATPADLKFLRKVVKVLEANHVKLPEIAHKAPRVDKDKQIADLSAELSMIKASLTPAKAPAKTGKAVRVRKAKTATVEGAPGGVERRVEDLGAPTEGDRRIH